MAYSFSKIWVTLQNMTGDPVALTDQLFDTELNEWQSNLNKKIIPGINSTITDANAAIETATYTNISINIPNVDNDVVRLFTNKYLDSSGYYSEQLLYMQYHGEVSGIYFRILDGSPTNPSNIQWIKISTSKDLENLNIGNGNITVDTVNKLLKVQEGSTTYVAQLEELITPEAPTITTTNIAVVTGNANFIVTGGTPGATFTYSLDSGNWTSVPANKTIPIPSGFSNNTNNVIQQHNIKFKATKNGVSSVERSVGITIQPKVATPSFTITRSPANDGDYAISATIKVTNSLTIGASHNVSTDSGSTWTAPTPITTTSSVSANVYRVKATKPGYADSDVYMQPAITLNKKKAYMGFGGSTITASDIKTLIGGQVKNQSNANGEWTLNFTQEASAAGGYVWICSTGNVNQVLPENSQLAVPLDTVQTIDGYKCYRFKDATSANYVGDILKFTIS